MLRVSQSVAKADVQVVHSLSIIRASPTFIIRLKLEKRSSLLVRISCDKDLFTTLSPVACTINVL